MILVLKEFVKYKIKKKEASKENGRKGSCRQILLFCHQPKAFNFAVLAISLLEEFSHLRK